MRSAGDLVAIYCRLSKEDEEKLHAGDESGSIQNQKLMLMEYALQQGFMIYKVYSDDDYSGFSDRPQFNQMLKDAENRQFNIILCKHQSRFTRDMELVEKYIHGKFVLWGIRFISLTDHVDTNVKGGKKARQINGLINEWYCEDLSDNVKTVLRAKREQGQFVGAYVSYGYLKDPEDKHKLIIDEKAAQVVRDIFRMYLSGMGIQSIATKLTDMDVPTPTQHKALSGINYRNANSHLYSSEHGAWAINSVRRILRNETYIGSVVQGRERSISYKTKQLKAVPKGEWIIIPDVHEPIIDKRTFDTVQRLIAKKRTLFYDDKVSDAKTPPHLLAGKVVCLNCGSALHRSGASRDGSDRYLCCQLAAKTKRKSCTTHYISENRLQKIVEEKIRSFINSFINTESIEEITESVIGELTDMDNTIDLKRKQLAEAEEALKKIQYKLTMAYSDRLDGVITEADFIVFKSAFEEDKKALEKRKANLTDEIADFERADSKAMVAELISKYQTLDVLTHEVINDFIVSIQVGEKNPVTHEQEIIINWNV